jgi:hypothetical protein
MLAAGQVAAAHLVIHQVEGRGGPAGCFAGGAGQPFGIRLWSSLADDGEAVSARSQTGLAMRRSR